MTTRHPTEVRFFQASADLLEWPLVLLLTALNILLLSQPATGGSESLLPALLLCAAMIPLHALWQLLDRKPGSLRVHPFTLWLLPLWALALLQVLALTPAPWEARHQFTIFTIGLTGFWVGAHHLRKPAQIYLFLSGIASALILSLAMAVLQTTLRIEGLPWVLDVGAMGLRGSTSALAAEGIASGAFPSNRQLGTLLATLVPLMAVLGLATRFRRPMRITLLVLTAITLGVLVTTRSASSLLIALALLWVAPLVGRSRDFTIPKAMLITLAITVIALLLGCLLSPATVGWIGSGFAADSSAPVAAAAVTATANAPAANAATTAIGNGLSADISGGLGSELWHLFASHWLTGIGAGNLDIALQYSAHGSSQPAANAVAAIPAIFIQSGIIIGAATLGIILFLLASLLRNWRQMPLAVPVEQENLDRSWRRYCQPLPTVIAGATLLGLTAFTLELFFADPLRQPCLPVLALSLFGLAAHQLPLRLRALPAHRLAGSAIAAVALLLSVLLLITSVPPLRSRMDTAAVEKQIAAWQQASVSELLQQAPKMEQAANRLRDAIQRDPDNAPALTALSNLLVLRHIASTGQADSQTLARATSAAQAALAIHPHYLPAWLALSQAQHSAGDIQLAEQTLAKATDFAPGNFECWYRMAMLLKQEPGKREQALLAVNKALAIAPANALAQRLHWQLMIP